MDEAIKIDFRMEIDDMKEIRDRIPRGVQYAQNERDVWLMSKAVYMTLDHYTIHKKEETDLIEKLHLYLHLFPTYPNLLNAPIYRTKNYSKFKLETDRPIKLDA